MLTATDTRSRLLDVAAHRFLEDGYAATSVRSIASAMGIKAGSIYYHFDSKDDILAEVLDTGIELIAASVEDAISGMDDPVRRLQSAVDAHLGALFEHGAYTACHVRVFHQAPEDVRRRSTEARDRYETRWTHLLQDAVDAGALVADLDIHLARLFLLGALNATVDWFNEGDRSAEHLARVFGTLFMDGAMRKDWT